MKSLIDYKLWRWCVERESRPAVNVSKPLRKVVANRSRYRIPISLPGSYRSTDFEWEREADEISIKNLQYLRSVPGIQFELINQETTSYSICPLRMHPRRGDNPFLVTFPPIELLTTFRCLSAQTSWSAHSDNPHSMRLKGLRRTHQMARLMSAKRHIQSRIPPDDEHSRTRSKSLERQVSSRAREA